MTILQDFTETMHELWNFSGLKDAPTVHIKFQFLTHSLMEIMSLTDFLKDLYSAAIVVT